MKKVSVALLVCILAACSNPKDIVLGPEPLKTLEANGDAVRKLPEEERKLLVGYLMASEAASKFGIKDGAQTVAGMTIGEVLTKAKEKVEEEKKRQQEAEALKAKVEAERKAIEERIASLITIAVTGKRVIPEDMYARRYEDHLELKYAIENKGEKDIRMLKGRMYFYDATGDEIGWLPLTFEEKIPGGKTIKTDNGVTWKIRDYGKSDIKKIAYAQFEGMTSKFKPQSIAFVDGEVIKAPE